MSLYPNPSSSPPRQQASVHRAQEPSREPRRIACIHQIKSQGPAWTGDGQGSASTIPPVIGGRKDHTMARGTGGHCAAPARPPDLSDGERERRGCSSWRKPCPCVLFVCVSHPTLFESESSRPRAMRRLLASAWGNRQHAQSCTADHREHPRRGNLGHGNDWHHQRSRAKSCVRRVRGGLSNLVGCSAFDGRTLSPTRIRSLPNTHIHSLTFEETESNFRPHE